MSYLCPKCQDIYDEEELIRRDVGGSEEAFGSLVHKPEFIYITPCCGVEAEEILRPWWNQDDHRKEEG